jgi:hypothetical protein
LPRVFVTDLTLLAGCMGLIPNPYPFLFYHEH